jgi:hypothetical protein
MSSHITTGATGSAADGSAALDPVSPRDGQSEPTVAAPEDLCALSGMPKKLCALYSALVDADDQGDAQALARLGWVLFTQAGEAQQAQDEAVGLLAELRAAACAVAAADGSPASLGLLHHVLAKHGWLPPPDATPLQMLAAPPKEPRSSGPAQRSATPEPLHHAYR